MEYHYVLKKAFWSKSARGKLKESFLTLQIKDYFQDASAPIQMWDFSSFTCICANTADSLTESPHEE